MSYGQVNNTSGKKRTSKSKSDFAGPEFYSRLGVQLVGLMVSYRTNNNSRLSRNIACTDLYLK